MNKQKGFSTVIVLLSVLVVTAVGFAGYYVYNQQENKSKQVIQQPNKSEEQTNPKPSDEPEKVADVSTYCGKDVPACFDYPKTWQLTKQALLEGMPQDIEIIKLTTPNGSTITYGQPFGIGGYCPAEDYPLSSANYSDITYSKKVDSINGYVYSITSNTDQGSPNAKTITNVVLTNVLPKTPNVGKYAICDFSSPFHAIQKAGYPDVGFFPQTNSDVDNNDIIKMMESYRYQ